jgi:hypothetical protein
MSSTRETATRLILVRALLDRVRKVEAALKAGAAGAGFDVAGVRDVGVVDGTPIGTVQVAAGAESWSVTDEAKFLEWVRANAPTEIETVEQVRPAFRSLVLGDVRGGTFAADTIPDGVTRTLGRPTVTVRPASDAGDVIAAAVAAGTLRWGDVLELDAVPAPRTSGEGDTTGNRPAGEVPEPAA